MPSVSKAVMKPSDLQTKLMGAARAQPTQDHVPYAFEKRIMARIAAASQMNPWALCGTPALARRTFVRGHHAGFAGCGLWRPRHPASGNDTFAQDFERTVYASLNQHVEDTW